MCPVIPTQEGSVDCPGMADTISKTVCSFLTIRRTDASFLGMTGQPHYDSKKVENLESDCEVLNSDRDVQVPIAIGSDATDAQ